MMTPDVSIIVPVYNAEAYLPRCLDSIVGQTLQNWELLLVDDGSTDGSGTICDAYASRDSRICVIHQKNSGVSAARNAGLEAASGTYIGFVDADDWISDTMFQTLFSAATEKTCNLVMCDAVTVYSDGHTEQDTITRLESSCILNKKDISPELLLEMAGSVCRCLYRTETLRRYAVKFPSGIKFSEDRIFNILCFGYAGRIAYEKAAYYSRFINTTSTVHRFHEDYFESYKMAADGIEQAIRCAWDNDPELQKAYLGQFIGGAIGAVCNYCYKTSTLSAKERKNKVRALCDDQQLRATIEVHGADRKSQWILDRKYSLLIGYAKLANLKHRR